MDVVEGAIARALPELTDADVMRLVDKLRDLGVDGLADMADIEEGDLVPPLKKLKARKLLKAFGVRGQVSATSETADFPQRADDDEDDFEVLPQTSRSSGRMPRGPVNHDFRQTTDANMTYRHTPQEYTVEPTKMKPCYRLLLLGKTGEGKSATGNSILGRKEFVSKSDTKSVTKTVNQAYCDRGDYLFKIIDGPGTGETRLNKEKAVEKATKDLTRAMEKCTEGFHAMVMVYKFGNRFTLEDQDSIDFLKRMLGSDVFKLYGICVITCGDQFRGTMEDDDTPEISITEWCKKQDDKSDEDEHIKFSSLLNECGNRVVLFDNRTKNEDDQNAQIEQLLETIRSLPSQGKLYTNDQFDAMYKERKRLIIETKLPQMEESIQEKCSLIQEALEKIKLSQPNAGAKMNELKMKAQELISEIIAKDAGTGVLLPLKDNVGLVMRTIVSFEEAQREMKEKEQQNLNAEEMRKLKAENEAHIKKLQEQIDEGKKNLNKTVKVLQKEAEDEGFVDSLVSFGKGVVAPLRWAGNTIAGWFS